MLWSVLCVLLATVFVLLYVLDRRKLSYWKRRGVAQLRPLPFVGDIAAVLKCEKSLGQFYEEIYFKIRDEKYVGLYELEKPTLLVKDLEMIENIVVKDFSYFVNRGIGDVEDDSDVAKGLPQLKDSEWRAVRYKTSPAFSSGKLKFMFPTMNTCARRMMDYIESESGTELDVQEISTRYATDVIATCAFGIDVSKDLHKNSTFRIMGNRILNLGKYEYYAFLFVILLPRFAAKLGLKMTVGKVGKYFGDLIKDTMTLREKSAIKRNDFIDLLLQLKQKGSIEVQSKDPDDNYLKIDYEPSAENIEMTDQILISQAFTFLPAGFDGISTPMCCILYELAKNSCIQDKVRRDIENQIEKYGSLTYEALKNSKYLDCCINEGLRLYPLSSFIQRQVSKTYELEPGVTIEPGTKVIICNSASQIDPAYYTDPLVFDPDRFDGELTMTVSDFSYLPFGAGPRICIGMRMAQLIMKLGLATIISNYRIALPPASPRNIEMKVRTFFVNKPETVIYFRLNKIK